MGEGDKSKTDILRWMALMARLLNILYEEERQEVKLHSSGIQASLSLRHRVTAVRQRKYLQRGATVNRTEGKGVLGPWVETEVDMAVG